MKKTLQNVVKELEERGIEIYGNNTSKGKCYIMAQNMIITVPKKNNIVIDFHVSSTPVFSANIINILKDLDIKITVGNIFIYDKDGIVFEGTEAIDKFEDIKKDEIIRDFVEDQIQKQFLIQHQYGSA